MTYRDLPAKAPLLVCSDRLIQAFDSGTGRPLWTKAFAPGVIGYLRLASTGERVLAAVDKTAMLLDVMTGAVLLEMTLWFRADSALGDGDTLVLMGYEGLACFDATGFVWGIRHENGESWLEDAAGKRVMKIPQFAGHTSRPNLGLVLGRTVFQPDIEG